MSVAVVGVGVVCGEAAPGVQPASSTTASTQPLRRSRRGSVMWAPFYFLSLVREWVVTTGRLVRRRSGAEPVVLGCFSGCGFEGDFVAEGFEVDVSGGSGWVGVLVVVVGAEVVVAGVGVGE